MGFFERITEGLRSSRDKFKESMNVLLDRGPDLDEGFWEDLEETLILSDVGGPAALDIVERLQDQATRKALPDAYAVLDLLNDEIAATFTPGGEDILGGEAAVVLFVGINGTGKTTTVGKIAKEQADQGRRVILGSGDTFRAAAIEQLEVWARRADVEMVTRERGSDPASVCFDTLERAEAVNADLVLIDTAGRLHTSADLMRELEKVVKVVRKRSTLPVFTVLVIDATTGQNGLQQAQEFNRALDLDALIVTKLDGSAKGGIALAVSHELRLPIIKIGVGEGIDDLRDFDAHDFASALIGDFDERYDEEEDGYAGENVREAAITAGERRRDVIEGARENAEWGRKPLEEPAAAPYPANEAYIEAVEDVVEARDEAVPELDEAARSVAFKAELDKEAWADQATASVPEPASVSVPAPVSRQPVGIPSVPAPRAPQPPVVPPAPAAPQAPVANDALAEEFLEGRAELARERFDAEADEAKSRISAERAHFEGRTPEQLSAFDAVHEWEERMEEQPISAASHEYVGEYYPRHAEHEQPANGPFATLGAEELSEAGALASGRSLEEQLAPEAAHESLLADSGVLEGRPEIEEEPPVPAEAVEEEPAPKKKKHFWERWFD